MDHLCYLWLVFVMLLRLFIAALWSPADLLAFFVMFNFVFPLSHEVSLVRCDI